MMKRHNHGHLPTALVALASMAAPPSWAAKVAVLAWREGNTANSALANDVRAGLPALRSGDVVLDADTLRRALRGPVEQPLSLVAIKTTLAAAEEAFAAVEHERAVSLIESVISELEHDTDFSVEKHELLQAAHLRCARLLLGLAGPKETGRAETPQGVKARIHLEAALRTDPTLALDPTSTPPKLRGLLGLAAAEVKKRGYGAIAVTSSPAGATVYADGRALGLTPLTTADTLSRGPYRIWVAVPQQSDYRSFARVVDVAGEPARVSIDLGIEGAAWPEGPGLSQPILPLHKADVQALAALLGADEVVVTGTHAEQGFVAVFTSDGELRRSGQLAKTATGQQVASFVTTGNAADVTSAPLFPEFYTANDPSAVADEADGPWLGVGLGIGAAVVAAGAVGAVLYFTRTRAGTFDLTLTETP
jgi:hypothetical protein